MTNELTSNFYCKLQRLVTLRKTPLNVVFTDKSTGKTTKWKWSFGY
ncbi:MAG: hypothetical protein RBR63_05025 [Methanosarcina vacuolata]|nr:hypothetical protein [Methanosarcina vacuolata]